MVRQRLRFFFLPQQLDYIVTNGVIHTVWLWQRLRQCYCTEWVWHHVKVKVPAATLCEHF